MNIVIYHKNCMDGVCAAAVCHMAIKEETKYFAMQYGDDWTKVIPVGTFEPTGIVDNIYIVDFSLPVDHLNELASLCKNIVVLDHHQSAIDKLDRTKVAANVKLILDTTKSGCRLAWEYFFQGPPPPLVLYTEDRDLWAWKLGATKPVMAAMQIVPLDIDDWLLHIDGEVPISHLINRGETILQYQGQLIGRALESAVRCDIAGELVGILTIQSPVLQSEIGNALVDLWPLEFVCIYFDDLATGRSILSFRSKNGSALLPAQRLGGGGHPNAAGARIPMGQIRKA